MYVSFIVLNNQQNSQDQQGKLFQSYVNVIILSIFCHLIELFKHTTIRITNLSKANQYGNPI